MKYIASLTTLLFPCFVKELKVKPKKQNGFLEKPCLLCSLFVLMFAGCNEEPHLKHKLAFTKVAEECISGTWNYKLISNTNGERYEFNQCLDATYNGTYTVERRRDTLVVQFGIDTAQTPKALFKLDLDVDAWPKYSHIYLGEQLLKVGHGS